MEGLTQKTRTLQASIVSGSVVLLSGSGLTTAINLSYNIVLARFLGPQGFGHATAVYTILTLISAVTLSFQIISAKVVAKQSSPEGKAAVYRGFHRSAWGCGILVALILVCFKGAIADYLNLPSPTLIALLAMGAAFYVPLGCRRGYIQGTYGFRRLATNLVVEGVVRLGGSLLLILLGLGVAGVIAANAAAVAVAYLAAAPKLAPRIPNPLGLSFALREASQAMIFFSGQVLINNCDIVLVKHFFSAKEAGLYAAVAMVGRVIFSFSSAVVNSMFPLVAGTRDEERKDLKVLAISLSLVLFTGSMLALGLIVAPARIWTTFFGSGFEIAGKYNLPYLLALYAITTIIYSLSVVIITFEMSYKIANTSWVQLAFSGMLIACLCRFHSSLREVILVQLVLMTALLVSVALPFLFKSLSNSTGLSPAGSGRSLRLTRHVSENEVIAEFLKSDFGSSEFREYQETLREVVRNPDLDNASENATRRALLFIRHRALWKEIPTGTEWYEVELADADLGQIRVFPRAQWRKLARGNFSITEVAACMRTHQNLVDGPFLSKIASIGDQLHQEDTGFSAVILIGLNESEPLTVLDGNHRLAAAMLASPGRLNKLRFLCGLSPRMTECCWYNTNLITLFRYGRNMLVRVLHNSEAELARLLQDPEQPRTSSRPGRSSGLSFFKNLSGSVLGSGSKPRTRENKIMTSQEVAATVMELPNTMSVKQGRRFLSELKTSMSDDCPCIVLDCSKVRVMNRSTIHMLLCCLEEVMKHNGDVRLGAVSVGATSTLDVTGVGHLFEIFETNEEALDSFRMPPADGALQISVPDSSHEAA